MFFSTFPFKLSVMLILREVDEGPYYYDWFFICFLFILKKDDYSDVRFERVVV